MAKASNGSRAGPLSDADLARLLREHYGLVFHYLLKVTMDRSFAEDLTQETMIRAIEKHDKYDGSSKFSTWLITIGTRIFLDAMRKRKRESGLLREQARVSAFRWETAARGGEWTELMECLEKLPREERLPLVLKHYYGYTYDEIGRMTGLPSGSVKSRIHYALRKLRKELNENGDERSGNRG
ncbi:RNA polymerase sigma factor SigY [Paenibacillaceae bacterium WGS1546]|uniref:RNA polymerase sigma factor SigY n=1 Tax=Cohnella sp. WGS1546 TaxID=3366810 RepID=UPI00372D6379